MTNQLELKLQHIAPARTIAWLRWTDDRGRVGCGEIAPLPGRNQETLQEAIEQINSERHYLLACDLDHVFLEDLMERKLWFPSVSFALESAFLQIRDPWTHSFQVATSALLMGSKREIEEQIPFIQGASVVKIKLKNLGVSEAKGLLETLASQYILRIDANLAWSENDILSVAQTIPKDRIEYFEEPCFLEDLAHSFPYTIAIDESCTESHVQTPVLLDPFLAKGVRCIVYKPSVHGGIFRGRKLFTWAKERGVRVILGSSFESPVGVACIADLARRLGSQEVLGLGTLPYLFSFTTCDLRYCPPLVYIPGYILIQAKSMNRQLGGSNPLSCTQLFPFTKI